MAADLRISPMSLADMEIAVEWAAAEGWNPGLEDIPAFWNTDPEGFLMGWLGDEPVACISVVRHTADFGFLGFYICAPEYRGKGYGWALWQAGLAHLGARTIGLDGVPDQEENYRRSGFEFAFRSHRYEGEITGRAHAGFTAATPADADEIIALDAAVNGVERRAFVEAWATNSPRRLTMLSRDGGRITAMGTIRACRVGHKIGPLIAPDTDTAIALTESLVHAAGAAQVAIDIPETSVVGAPLPGTFDLKSAFACARMYKGQPPRIDHRELAAIATFELG